MDTSAHTKNSILDAAQIRFSRYGFNKTTMAEIAKDCEMSAANLYRFFPSKEDIGTEIALRCFSNQEALLREILRRPGLTASQRLETFILELLHATYDLFANQPCLSELVLFISQKHWELVKRHKLEVQKSLLAEVLAEGNWTEEFDVPDILATAELIQSATVKFH
ncbi:MAG: TetR/AcrR family transcriptional regulator, partial [Nitrospira sp.]|nr:TetR/AcrR family transcriptional regulator [Nitrospira sp.]